MQKKRILIIDDEESFSGMLKLNLEETGEYEVREENKGARGSAAAKEFQPDLIFLDVIMPDMLGNDVFVQIRADENLKNTPIVFLTAVVTEEEEGIIGGHPFLAKPVTMEKVIDCINENLTK